LAPLYPPGAERWRIVPGAPDYVCSDRGTVKRITPGSGTQAGPLTPCGCPSNGTLRVTLRVPASTRAVREGEGRRRKTVTRYVHHLVLLAFVGPPGEGETGEHIDGDLSNNALSNLRWRKPPGVIGNAKIDAEKAAAIRAQRGRRTQADIAVEYGVSPSMVGLILRGKAWPEARP
jgi:hypothetical protein